MNSSSIFSQAIINSQVGFCVIDECGKILLINDALACILPSKKMVGKHLSMVVKLSRGGVKKWINALHQERQAQVEIEFRDQEVPFFAIANASIIEEDGRQLIGIFFTESNEQKLLANELERQVAIEIEKNRKKELMMQSQAKLATMGEMIANIAHQWRQPLNILALILQDNYIKFQLKQLTEEIVEKNYEKANNLLQYMSQTIDDFRSFFKNDERQEPFEIRQALESILELVGTRFATTRTKVIIPKEGEFWAHGTQNGFKQVIINLLNNAHEAILASKQNEGKIEVTISEDAKYFHISIADNGGGVPTNIMEQIFEPYFTTKHQTQGTGLGLYMSKQIIEKNDNGKLEVSNGEEGAIFCVGLPKANAPQ